MGTAISERPTQFPQYSDKQKAEALSLLDLGMSLREVARETGVPFQTIGRWRAGMGETDGVSEERDALNEELAAKFELVANKLVNSVAKMSDEDLSEATVIQRMSGAGVAVDKMRLLRGEASPDATLAATTAIKARAMSELARMISAGRQGNSVGGTLSVTGTTDAPDEAGNTTDVVIDAIGVSDASAPTAPTLTGETRADTPATLGTCQVCGELAADKVTKGGARVCSTCIP